MPISKCSAVLVALPLAQRDAVDVDRDSNQAGMVGGTCFYSSRVGRIRMEASHHDSRPNRFVTSPGVIAHMDYCIFGSSRSE